MNWKQWPFYPKTLTDMIGPPADVADREGFVSLLVSGCRERLGRPLTVLEPALDATGQVRQEPDPDNPGRQRLKLRRIDQINSWEQGAGLCAYLRQLLPGQTHLCRLGDPDVARQVIRTALEQPQALGEFLRGYRGPLGLIDQAAVIRHYRTPVAVIFSGQFLPDEPEARQQLQARLAQLAGGQGLTPEQQQALQAQVDRLETRDQFIDRYFKEKTEHSPEVAAPPGANRPTVDRLFLAQVREIERIAGAQFQMHKRDRESEFRHVLRHQFPFLPLADRAVIADAVRPVLEEVRRFCGSDYLALFISPQRYISFEENPNLLPPFAFTGVAADVREGLLHFNWRKAGLSSKNNSTAAQAAKHAPAVRFLTDRTAVQQAVRSGLKGEPAAFFEQATILCRLSFADAYRAVLLWGPFPHLTGADLQREVHFLEEVSELVLVRVLSSVQRTDSERRTGAWSDVAGLLGHYSRRAMTPVSTGVRIISDYLKGGGTYSKEDALNATESLEAAAIFIAQAVRAPLASFAAMAEEVYRFAPASLHQIVQEAVALYRPLALEKSVTIKIDDSLARLPPVEVDAAKLRDAVGYVLDNAIKYSHPDKEVRIYGKDLGPQVRLTIEDFGQGIRDEERHLVFGRGYQGERSRKAIYEPGEGMGLFHARLIVEAHKGKIWCGCRSGLRSDTSARLEGYRVWFTFELPVKQEG